MSHTIPLMRWTNPGKLISLNNSDNNRVISAALNSRHYPCWKAILYHYCYSIHVIHQNICISYVVRTGKVKMKSFTSPSCICSCCYSWGDCLMFFHMFFAVNSCSKAFITEWALVRLHAHVSCHVPGKAAISCEGSIANATAECFNSLK